MRPAPDSRQLGRRQKAGVGDKRQGPPERQWRVGLGGGHAHVEWVVVHLFQKVNFVKQILVYVTKIYISEKFLPLLLCVFLCEFEVLPFSRFALKTDKFYTTKVAKS